MIIDGLLLFDSAAAVTSTAASTNIVDLVNARDIGVGDDPAMKVMVLVTTAITTTNSATLTVSAQGSTDNSTWSTYVSSPAYAAAALVAGARLFDIDWPRPAAGLATPRYIRLYYTVGTGIFSAGAVTAALVLDRDDRVNAAGAYPAGIAIAN